MTPLAKRKVGLSLIMLMAAWATTSSKELMTTADVMEEGTWSWFFYGGQTKTELKVKPSAGSQLSSGTENSTGGSKTEIDLEQKNNQIVTGIRFRPRGGLIYTLNVGQISDFRLSYSSGSHTNTYQGMSHGVVWGGRVQWNFQPGTIVSTAYSLDAQFAQNLVNLDKFDSNGTVFSTNSSWKQDQVQIALNISRRFKKIEPYGGLKVFRVHSQLQDKDAKETVKGDNEGLSPFAGIRWDMFSGESIVVEGSLMDEKSINIGFNLQF